MVEVRMNDKGKRHLKRNVLIGILVLTGILIVLLIYYHHEKEKHKIIGYIEATPEDTTKPRDISQTPEYKRMGLLFLAAENLHYRDGKIKQAIDTLRAGLQLAQSIDKKALELFYNRLAIAFMDSSLEDSALFYSDLAIKASSNYYAPYFLGVSYYNRAVILKRFYHINEAIEYYEKAYNEFVQTQTHVYAAAVAAELALCSEALGDYKKATRYRFMIGGFQNYAKREKL